MKLLLAFTLLTTSAMVSFAQQNVDLTGRWATDSVKTAKRDDRGYFPLRKGSSPDGVALVIDFSSVGTFVTGKVTEFVSGAEYRVEDFKRSDRTFEFTTYKKVGSVSVGTTYRSELADDGTIIIVRFNPSGKPIDISSDGTQVRLILRRSPIPEPVPSPNLRTL